ncbi:uncharacterized protein PgNI_09052 [Pyricularia grisea]|uniref:Uncharacterized protein n=1 Tax=Pyricularia grisea TaxID=148305 RepID=A0A6P8AUG2_PYRGI|nr:uncharacterized protein PgNI_09052 [Pyricularia grisea]TLD05863.1 hypothetical protein PgNI_09052 [Pyricularia grisea]
MTAATLTTTRLHSSPSRQALGTAPGRTWPIRRCARLPLGCFGTLTLPLFWDRTIR